MLRYFFRTIVIASFFCGFAQAQDAAESHQATVKELVRLCGEELEKVQSSAKAEIPSGALTPQTNAAHDNISWAVERFEKLCQSKEYWETSLDNMSAGAAIKNDDVSLAATVLEVASGAYADWQEVMNTFNTLVSSTQEAVKMRQILEIKRREEERLRRIREAKESKERLLKEEAIRAKQEYIQKQLNKRQRLKEIERMNKVVEENTPKTKTQAK